MAVLYSVNHSGCIRDCFQTEEDTDTGADTDTAELQVLTKIPSPSKSILDQFAVQHHIHRLSQLVT